MKTLKLIIVIYMLLLSMVLAPPVKGVSAVIVHKIKIVKLKPLELALSHPKAYALKVLQIKGYSKEQYACLVKLWNYESHWNYKAKNPRSSAKGIGQLLIEKSNDPATQIRD